MRELLDRYDVILFDLGNTLIRSENPGTAFEDMQVEFLPGVLEVLDALHGRVPMGIVSNTTYITAAQIAEKLGEQAARFDVIIATAELGVHKPSPEPLLVALRALGMVGRRGLYVGDRETDLQAATAAGLAFAYTGRDLAERLRVHRCPNAWERALAGGFPRSPEAGRQAQEALDTLAKPRGSLGRLEHAVVQLAEVQGTSTPTVDPAGLLVFTADHGIAADDTVTPWPQAVTGIMRNAVADGVAAVSVLARNADLYVEVVDVGSLPDVPSRVVNRRVAPGTADLRDGPAMTAAQAQAALEVGAEAAERIIAGGTRFLALGEIGIGNTTAAAALIAALCDTPADVVTGRGSGIDDDTLTRKRAIVADAVAGLPADAEPLDVLARVGGLEIAAMAGAIVAAASVGVPVLLDGVITQAAALVAARLEPRVLPALLASHCSAEPGSVVALQALGLRALLDLDLRLGEGTGAALALPLLRGACAVRTDMARIDDLLG